MGAAPEMSPSLDEALRAMDRVLRSGPAAPHPDLLPVSRFLDQLDEVRNVPAVVLDRVQAEHMEGAYLAGVRCADESGHVLVVSLPAFLALHAPAPVLRPVGVFEWVGAHLGPISGGLAVFGSIAGMAGHFEAACALYMASFVGVVLNWVEGMAPSACTYDCNSGRECTCVPNQNNRT